MTRVSQRFLTLFGERELAVGQPVFVRRCSAPSNDAESWPRAPVRSAPDVPS
jgi:hypothetical protein